MFAILAFPFDGNDLSSLISTSAIPSLPRKPTCSRSQPFLSTVTISALSINERDPVFTPETALAAIPAFHFLGGHDFDYLLDNHNLRSTPGISMDAARPFSLNDP